MIISIRNKRTFLFATSFKDEGGQRAPTWVVFIYYRGISFIKKRPAPKDPRHRPTVGSWGGAPSRDFTPHPASERMDLGDHPTRRIQSHKSAPPLRCGYPAPLGVLIYFVQLIPVHPQVPLALRYPYVASGACRVGRAVAEDVSGEPRLNQLVSPP